MLPETASTRSFDAITKIKQSRQRLIEHQGSSVKDSANHIANMLLDPAISYLDAAMVAALKESLKECAKLEIEICDEIDAMDKFVHTLESKPIPDPSKESLCALYAQTKESHMQALGLRDLDINLRLKRHTYIKEYNQNAALECPNDPRLPIEIEVTPTAKKTKLNDEDSGDAGDELTCISVKESYICPITVQQLSKPVRNTVCNHSYSKAALLELLNKSTSVPKMIRCPVTGCSSSVTMEGLKHDTGLEMKLARIEKRKLLLSNQNTATANNSHTANNNYNPSIGNGRAGNSAHLSSSSSANAPVSL